MIHQLVVLFLLSSLQAVAVETSIPLLDIQSLAETLNSVSETEKLTNARLFLKSSGDNWEKVRACGGTKNSWVNNLRLSDLSRTPKNATEAKALRLAAAGIQASLRGDTQLYEQIQLELRKLDAGLSSCGLNYSPIDENTLKVLYQARIQLGSELSKVYFSGFTVNRRAVLSRLISCQREFLEKDDPSLDCYRNLLPRSASIEKIDQALTLAKEAAILTILIERNQKPPCVKLSQLTTVENENYNVAMVMSPLYNMNISENFDSHQFTCRSGGL